MKKLVATFLTSLFLINPLGASAQKFQIQTGPNNFSVEIPDKEKENFANRLTSIDSGFASILALNQLNLIYGPAQNGHRPVLGAQLNNNNIRSAISHAMVVLTGILEMGSWTRMEPTFMTNFIQAFGANIVAFVLTILDFLGLIFS